MTVWVVLLCAVGNPLAIAGSAMEFNVIRQATPQRPLEYIIPIEVAADGYSTFVATVVSNNMSAIHNWDTVVREGGVDVVITTTKPIKTPKKIMLIAQYQGRDQAGHYWLQPVASTVATSPSLVTAVPAPATSAPATAIESENAPVADIRTCPLLLIHEGSLMENVEKLTADCGYAFGKWLIGDRDYLVDWRVKQAHRVDNDDGVHGLLALLASRYGLSGVIRHQGGKTRYIDYYEFRGGLVGESE